jgi:hypothetical protein
LGGREIELRKKTGVVKYAEQNSFALVEGSNSRLVMPASRTRAQLSNYWTSI